MSQQEPLKNFSTDPSEEESTHKRLVSERKIEANRRNALRSTGPKTPRGKRTVSRNAIKHGLLAREVVITAGDGEENAQEFFSLVERLCVYYEPVGVIEGMFVEKIATCWWRSARVLRAENGEIRRRLDTVKVDRTLRNSDMVNLALGEKDLDVYRADSSADDKVSTMDRWSALQRLQSNLRAHPAGLAFLSELLQIAKSEIDSDGCISSRVQREIFLAFSLWDYFFALACSCAPTEARSEGQSPDSVKEKEAQKERSDISEFIDNQLRRIALFKEYAFEREKLEGDAEGRSLNLPPADTTDKLLRYEVHLDRQLYRAMDQLERLQRQRKGESVPPPLNINLGRRN